MIKKITLSLLLLSALPVLAMPPAGNDEKATQHQQQRIEKMATILKLREDQIAKFGEVMQAQMAAQNELNRKHMEQKNALQDETLKQLSDVLDENQLARYEGFTLGMRMAGKHKRSKSNMGYQK